MKSASMWFFGINGAVADEGRTERADLSNQKHVCLVFVGVDPWPRQYLELRFPARRRQRDVRGLPSSDRARWGGHTPAAYIVHGTPVVADPYAAGEVGSIADEPGIAKILCGAGLTGGRMVRQTRLSPRAL